MKRAEVAESALGRAQDIYRTMICKVCIRRDRPCICDILAERFDSILGVDDSASASKPFVKVIDEVRDVLNHRLGIGWVEEDFQASDYESNDSIDVVNEITKILRDSGYSRLASNSESKEESKHE